MMEKVNAVGVLLAHLGNHERAHPGAKRDALVMARALVEHLADGRDGDRQVDR